MRFDTDNIDLLPFSSNTHLMHHLGYLFRTDKAQKWTNRHTDQNRIIMHCILVRLQHLTQRHL